MQGRGGAWRDYSRRCSSATVGIGVDDDGVNDVDHTIGQDDVGLDDESGDIALGDVLPGGVDGERESLATLRGEVL